MSPVGVGQPERRHLQEVHRHLVDRRDLAGVQRQPPVHRAQGHLRHRRRLRDGRPVHGQRALRRHAGLHPHLRGRGEGREADRPRLAAEAEVHRAVRGAEASTATAPSAPRRSSARDEHARCVRRAAALAASAVAVTGRDLGVRTPPTPQRTRPGRSPCDASSTALTLGHKVRMEGHVSKAVRRTAGDAAGARCPGRPWRDQRQARVRANGTFTTFDDRRPTYDASYRVVMPRTRTGRRGVSPIVTVAVYQWTQLTSLPPVNESFLDSVSVGVDERDRLPGLARGVDVPPERPDQPVGRVQPRPSVHDVPGDLRALRRLGRRPARRR